MIGAIMTEPAILPATVSIRCTSILCISDSHLDDDEDGTECNTDDEDSEEGIMLRVEGVVVEARK